MIAPTASMNPTVVTTGPEFGLDLGRSISAVGEHIIASVALVQQPIQFLAVVHGSIGHGIMPDQLVLGVCVHMVLVAEEAAAMLLGPARIAVLLPHFGGLLLPPRWGAASLQLGVLVTTVPLRRHQHDTGVDDLPATCHVAGLFKDAAGFVGLVNATPQTIVRSVLVESGAEASRAQLEGIRTS